MACICLYRLTFSIRFEFIAPHAHMAPSRETVFTVPVLGYKWRGSKHTCARTHKDGCDYTRKRRHPTYKEAGDGAGADHFPAACDGSEVPGPGDAAAMDGGDEPRSDVVRACEYSVLTQRGVPHNVSQTMSGIAEVFPNLLELQT